MSEESTFELGGGIVDEALAAELREELARRQQEYAAALSRLEDPNIESEQNAAYTATLGEMLALPTNAATWPANDPLWKLHRAMQYGDELELRRAEIEQRFMGRLPPPHVYSIKRYALATLHAFKVWRANPEPKESFAKLVKDAARLRELLLVSAAAFVAHDWIAPEELRHFGGGVTPEGIACDLFLLVGVWQHVDPERKARSLVTPVELIEAAVVARSLMQHAASKGHADLWEPTLQYARAYSLVDRASFQAELVLSEFHNVERDPYEAGEWKPGCLFCATDIERQHHYRAGESLDDARRRAQFVSSMMTSALRRQGAMN